eukprot:12424389-Ditylum_brightwellii.AAC.1
MVEDGVAGNLKDSTSSGKFVLSPGIVSTMSSTPTLTDMITPTESPIIKDSYNVSSTKADNELIDELVEF